MNYVRATLLIFASALAMLTLAACGPGIKNKEMKIQAETLMAPTGTTPVVNTPAGQAEAQGLINYDVTFQSLRVSSINGYSTEGTVKITLTDKRTGNSREITEFVRGVKEHITVDYLQSQTDEPRMMWSAQCDSMTCDRFNFAIVFFFYQNGQQVAATVLGIIQDSTTLKKAYMNFGTDISNFDQVINAVRLANP